MCKKKRSSASGRKQPPASTTTVSQPSQPPSLAVEPIDPEIKQAIVRSVALVDSEGYDKALDFIKESIFCHPRSGQLHHLKGKVHIYIADNVEKDCGAKLKHFEDGIRSLQLAVNHLPNSINCVSLLVDLLFQEGNSIEECDRVIELCKRGLRIENPTVSGVEQFYGEDVLSIEEEKRTIMTCLNAAEIQRNIKQFVAKRKIEVVNADVDINHIVEAMDWRKKKFRELMRGCKALKRKTSNWDDGKIEECKEFWSGSLSDEKKRGFRKVKIEELERHYKWLEYDLAVKLLSEAIYFAKEYKTWKFWECSDCVEKFGDYESYRIHFWEKHCMDLKWKLTSDVGIGKESIDMIVDDGVWKPVDTDEVIKIIVNHAKSESSSTSKTSVDNHPTEAFRNEIERAGILVRIRGMFDMLLKKKCLASSHVRWAIEYTKDTFESIIPLSHLRNHGQESLQMLCFLGTSQMTEVLTFLEDVARNCGLSENAEMDDKLISGDHINKKVVFSSEFSCLLYNAVAVDGSASAVVECEDDVLCGCDDIVSWLLMGSNCVKEALESWASLRDFQRGQAEKFLRMFDEKLLHLPTLCDTRIKISRKLTAVQAVDGMILEETKKREEIPEHEPKLYVDILKKRREELQETADISIRTELDVISNVLKGAHVVLSRDQSASDQCCVEDELGQQECMKLEDTRIKITLRRLKMQLLKDLSILDAIVLRYERELANISVHDYRSIIVPLLKAFLKPRLNDLFYKDAKEKSEAAAKELLAGEAREAETKKNNKGFDNMKQKQDKKKKKNKHFRKTKEPKATDDSSKHFELAQKDAEHNDNQNSKNGDSLDEPKQLTISDEERMLEKNLEYQRRIENEAKQKCLNDESIGENASECVRQTQDKKKKKNKKKKNKNNRKAKESKENDGGEQFQLCQDNASPDTELGDSVNVDKMEKLITKVGILDEHLEHKSQIENGDKKKCLEEKNDETDESIGENGVEGISVIYSKHIDDDEYEKRFQTDIEKASQWRLRLFRDELMSRSEKKHTHAGDPCFVCAYSDTYAAIRIATKELPRKAVVPFSSITLRPVYDFFKEWLNLENPVDDAEMGVSTSDYELKRHLVTVVWFVLSSVSYRNEDLHFLPIIYDINNFDFDSTQCSTDESILELSGHVMPVC
ncbi:hypothetical protein LWI28_020976 [Acer negundo]|uniref:C2H2-type domain-containing protein n=1 Tax=Acer negundo TaxID=4023 RepID=A0AAD5I7M9_ACENE|nr:hypothetical protein LWI28_020976 [Acer negundo]